MNARALLLPVLLGSCTNDFFQSYDNCLVSLESETLVALPGDEIVLSGGPFTADWDTIVRVGGVDAEVTAVDRDGCAPCDACRADADCLSCGTCEACEDACAACEQTAAFVVPAVPEGRQPVLMYNLHGPSERLYLEVDALPDTGDTDTDVPQDTSDTAAPTDTTDTGDTADTAHTGDSAATGDTSGTGDTADSSDTSDTSGIDTSAP